MQFAVDTEGGHIIVCGNYGCSGVWGRVSARPVRLSDNWLRHVQDVRQKHEKFLAHRKVDASIRRLCE